MVTSNSYANPLSHLITLSILDNMGGMTAGSDLASSSQGSFRADKNFRLLSAWAVLSWICLASFENGAMYDDLQGESWLACCFID